MQIISDSSFEALINKANQNTPNLLKTFNDYWTSNSMFIKFYCESNNSRIVGLSSYDSFNKEILSIFDFTSEGLEVYHCNLEEEKMFKETQQKSRAMLEFPITKLEEIVKSKKVYHTILGDLEETSKIEEEISYRFGTVGREIPTHYQN